MRARIRKSTEDGDAGFTLVELLVVVVILGVLAAIAIPSFLRQQDKAWQRATLVDLHNAAEAMESYFSDNGTYLGATPALFKTSDDVTVSIKSASATAYCIDADNAKLTAATVDYFFDSAAGKPAGGACP